MTVTAETVREVAEELRTHDLTSLADSLDIFAKKLMPAPDPDIELANELALAYFAQADHHRVVSHRYVTEGWLRVVATARKALAPSEPRVFLHGDVIPSDVQQVKDDIDDVYTRRKNGYFSLRMVTGYLPSDTFGTGLDGDAWAADSFPLTEVLES